MHRGIGVTLLALAAGLAGLVEVWRVLVFLGITSFNFVGREVAFTEPQWGQAIWAALIAAIWFWVAAGFWGVRAYAWQFGIFISLLTVVFSFFAMLGNSGTVESEFVPIVLGLAIYFYLNYPGVRDNFEQSEMSRLTPEQQAAVAKANEANAAAAAAMAAPAQAAPAQPAAAPAPTDASSTGGSSTSGQ